MPGTTRRSRARQPSSDANEENEMTQRSRASREDVDDEGNRSAEDEEMEEQPRRSKKASSGKERKQNAKKSKGKARASRHARNSDDEREQDDNRDAASIDVENFKDQPLSPQDGAKLMNLASDWEKVIETFRKYALTLATEVASGMAEAGMGMHGGQANKELARIDAVMRELLDTQTELRAHQDVLDGMRNQVALGEKINNVEERYDEGVKERVKAWSEKTSRQKYAKDPEYSTFKQRIHEIQRPDEPMPPVSELIDIEDGDESDDDDVAVGGVTQEYRCPLTLTRLVEPLTCTTCKHTFSAGAIRDYCSHSKSLRQKCPATGCKNLVSFADFKPDKELEKRVNAYYRLKERRAAEVDDAVDDADEVLE